MSVILTISNLWHAASRISTCAELEFRLCWMKLCSSFFLLSGFSFMDTDNSQDSGGRGGDHLLFHSTTFTRSQTFRHLFATFHVRWLSHIFNRNACIYQTATRWDLPPYRITIWLIDDVILIFVYLIVGLILGFATAIWHEKPVDSNSHRLSSLYYEQTD